MTEMTLGRQGPGQQTIAAQSAFRLILQLFAVAITSSTRDEGLSVLHARPTVAVSWRS